MQKAMNDYYAEKWEDFWKKMTDVGESFIIGVMAFTAIGFMLYGMYEVMKLPTGG